MTISLLIIGMNIQAQKVYLADNGVTIKASADAKAGDTGVVNGVTYTVVDSTTLINKIAKGDDVTKVCTSLINDMSFIFRGASAFNQDISSWDVSNVTNMSGMFAYNDQFNQNLSEWLTWKVTDMSNMFFGADAFNQDISSWVVDKVTKCSGFIDEGSPLSDEQLPHFPISGCN